MSRARRFNMAWDATQAARMYAAQGRMGRVMALGAIVWALGYRLIIAEGSIQFDDR